MSIEPGATAAAVTPVPREVDAEGADEAGHPGQRKPVFGQTPGWVIFSALTTRGRSVAAARTSADVVRVVEPTAPVLDVGEGLQVGMEDGRSARLARCSLGRTGG